MIFGLTVSWYLWYFLVFVKKIDLVSSVKSDEEDSKGYIAFCPCMGRFGNQADHFLGVLALAHKINRTLILPPWVEYKPGLLKSIQVPFTNYFQLDPLMEYTKVITMEDFMEKLAPTVWPQHKRYAFCYMARHKSNGCNAKEGNPFGPFWDTFNVSFVGSEIYGPLSYDAHSHFISDEWNRRYPPSKFPVLAFAGAPASFPVQLENRELQKYLQWNERIETIASAEIKKLPRGPFIAIHLRNGIDWAKACEHVDQSPSFFASPQCLGFKGENGVATRELCFPSRETILKQLKRAVKNISAKSIFVSSDNDHMMKILTEAMSKMQVSVWKLEKSNVHTELAVMAKANHFIGNCVSSFSAFVKRERDVKGFSSSFWAFPLQKKIKNNEL